MFTRNATRLHTCETTSFVAWQIKSLLRSVWTQPKEHWTTWVLLWPKEHLSIGLIMMLHQNQLAPLRPHDDQDQPVFRPRRDQDDVKTSCKTGLQNDQTRSQSKSRHSNTDWMCASRVCQHWGFKPSSRSRGEPVWSVQRLAAKICLTLMSCTPTRGAAWMPTNRPWASQRGNAFDSNMTQYYCHTTTQSC